MRIFRRDEDGIPYPNWMIDAINVNDALAAHHIQNVLPRMGVQRKGAAGLHLNQICADFRAIHRRRRHTCPPSNAGERLAGLINQANPLTLKNVANVILADKPPCHRIQDRVQGHRGRGLEPDHHPRCQPAGSAGKLIETNKKGV